MLFVYGQNHVPETCFHAFFHCHSNGFALVVFRRWEFAPRPQEHLAGLGDFLGGPARGVLLLSGGQEPGVLLNILLGTHNRELPIPIISMTAVEKSCFKQGTHLEYWKYTVQIYSQLLKNTLITKGPEGGSSTALLCREPGNKLKDGCVAFLLQPWTELAFYFMSVCHCLLACQEDEQ